MAKKKEPITARIIIINSCDSCPYRESIPKSGGGSYCYNGMFTILSNPDEISSKCPLEEIDIEFEEGFDDESDE